MTCWMTCGVVMPEQVPVAKQFRTTPLRAAVAMDVPDWMYPKRSPFSVVYGQVPGAASVWALSASETA